MQMTITLPDYDANKEAYREYILRHKDELPERDEIRNSDCLIEWAEEGKDLHSLHYGYSQEPAEIFEYILKYRGISCEFVERGVQGVSFEGQTDNLLLVDEEFQDRPEIQALLKQDMSW